MSSLFIALSGIDGAGKSTQLSLLKTKLESRGESVVCLWTRGGSTPGALVIKTILRIVAGKRLPASGHSARRDELLGRAWIQQLWLMLAIVDLIRIYGIALRWFLFLGKSVICDRYLWDSLIDFKIMFPNAPVERMLLWKFLVWCAPVPAKSVLLIIPLELSEMRCTQKYEPFPDTPERRRRRFQLYEKAANFEYWHVIDSTMPAEDVFLEISKKLF